MIFVLDQFFHAIYVDQISFGVVVSNVTGMSKAFKVKKFFRFFRSFQVSLHQKWGFQADFSVFVDAASFTSFWIFDFDPVLGHYHT